MKTNSTAVMGERIAARVDQDSRAVALRALIERSDQLLKEMEFAFNDVPAGVDAHMAMVRLAIADARQQLMSKTNSTTENKASVAAEVTRKTYKVWIEIEEYDEETGIGENMEAWLSFASTAQFPSLDEATQFAERLHATGEQLAIEY